MYCSWIASLLPSLPATRDCVAVSVVSLWGVRMWHTSLTLIDSTSTSDLATLMAPINKHTTPFTNMVNRPSCKKRSIRMPNLLACDVTIKYSGNETTPRVPTFVINHVMDACVSRDQSAETSEICVHRPYCHVVSVKPWIMRPLLALCMPGSSTANL